MSIMFSLQDELSKIVVDGAFGENVDLVSFKQNTNHKKMDQFMSTVIFCTITTSDKSDYNLVIKLKTRDEKMLKAYNLNIHFHNEIIMYEKIIPYLLSIRSTTTRDICNVPSFPRYFYGRNRCDEVVENDLLVLENVIPLGYRICEERIFLDYDHLICGIQGMAKFHALSYTAKHKDPVGFQEITSYFREMIIVPGNSASYVGNLWKYGQRGVERLLERSGDLYRDHEHLRKFNELTRESEHSTGRALRPREPLSVVCHGDFNRNNVLFRYDDNGNPVDTLIFDFGISRYGSPAIDLSYFLYNNTTQTMRRDRWDDLLDAYCAAVAEYVPAGVRIPDRTELDSEMAASAFYGASLALVLLPLRMSNGNVEDMMDEEYHRYVELGGDADTERVADVVQHFVDMAYTNV